MVKIIYQGDISPCRVRAGNSYIAKWEKGEVKDLDRETAKKILTNKSFSLAGSKRLEEKKEEEDVKEKKVIESNISINKSKEEDE